VAAAVQAAKFMRALCMDFVAIDCLCLDSPVTLGSSVSWFPKSERWRIEVTDPQTMKAVWLSHNVLCDITEVVTRDPELVSGLVQIYRAEIEQHIRRARSWRFLRTWPAAPMKPRTRTH